MTTQLTDQTFDAEILASGTPVLVDFWAEWCPPCHAIAPALDELSGEFEGRARIVKINVDDNPRTAIKYGVRSLPTLIVFKNGDPVAMQIGASPKSRLSALIEKAL